ncbi:MAG: amidohydrolase, partial [Armatimonadetes bacterium]|nr:amidohydrolase [Armatimonadota bacterium]
ALEAAGIGPETADPPGGEIARDASGHPTGILKEAAKEPMLMVVARPEPGALRHAAEEATAAAHRMGIVGVHNMAADGGFGLSSEHGPGVELLSVFQRLRSDGALGVRMWLTIPGGTLDRAIEAGLRTGQGDEWLRIGGVKVFADGTLGSQTASMLEPFEGQPGNTGIAIHPPETLADLVGRAVRVGVWPVIHAIGDRANRDVLDAFALHRDAARRAGVRFRIEHVQLLHPVDLPRLAALGVVASMQPIHATSDRDIADRYWGARSRTGYAWRSLLRAGTALAFGSDAPVETLDPWQGIYAAVTRRRPGNDRGAWYPEEAVTIDEAVRAYTVGAAWASGEEGSKGMLAPGRLADFIVLDRDVIQEAPRNPEALLQVRVLATLIDGQPVYTAGPLAGLS